MLLLDFSPATLGYLRARYLARADSGAGDQAAGLQQGGSSPGPENLPPSGLAVVAWDLTLRCPVCNSNVDGNRREYHCRNCARKGR